MSKSECYAAGAWLDSHWHGDVTAYHGGMALLGAMGCAVDRVEAGQSAIHIIYPPNRDGVPRQVGLFNANTGMVK